MPNPVAPALQTAAHLNGATRLTHLGVLRATGEDAIAFLQGQLTQDVALLPAGQTRLAAYCTPRGRVLTSFWVYKTSAQQLLLLASADRLAATLGRLQMYVLRAKVTLSDATAEFDIRGLLGDAAGQTPRDVWLPLPPADGAARALWLAPAGSPAPAAPPLTEAQWLWAEVRSGVARITAPVVEAFIPQMLNYESLGGVSFKKGCYTGQEVVARSQFRGTVKR
ncbi:MAG: folate-binding protein, partial [Burkholderiaceae bacterium]|nr:folate-binding protein [Burkholderiaceae bacterium]